MAADEEVEIEVQIVSYGEAGALVPLLASLRAQTRPAARVRIWHNGPRFDGAGGASWGASPGAGEAEGADLRPVWDTSGENLGFGEGHNRLFATGYAPVVVVANPDLVLEPRCLEALASGLVRDPAAVLAAAALADTGVPPRVNAFAQRLTWDLLGLNPDRGRPWGALLEAAAGSGDYVAPSGALFAVHRGRWEALGGGPLFPAGLFLYLEDLALGLRVQWRGGGLRLCPDARAVHAFSATTGARSALKLYHVERNRLWLLRALEGRAGALARLPFTALRYGAYALAARRRGGAAGDPELAAALLRGVRDGLVAPVPDDLRTYLEVPGPRRWRAWTAPLREQLRDPTAA